MGLKTKKKLKSMKHFYNELMSGLDSELRTKAGKVIKVLEAERGDSYPHSYRSGKMDKIADFLRDRTVKRNLEAWEKLNTKFSVPEAPQELERYENSVQWLQMRIARMKEDSDTPMPAKPKAVSKFEREIKSSVAQFLKIAKKHNLYWGQEFLDTFDKDIYRKFKSKKKTNTVRKPRFKGTKTIRFNDIAGTDESPFSKEGKVLNISTNEARERLKSFIDQKGMDLVFSEEMTVNGQNRAVFERESESETHQRLIDKTIGLFKRQGYSIYPGGVGLEGIYCMADFLAIDKDNNPIFVECLTKASIKKGGHIKKMQLAIEAPMLFIGELPEAFIKQLPKNCYAMESPSISYMQNKELVPVFYRSQKFTHKFVVKVIDGRKNKKIIFSMPSVNLEEDVSSFLWVAVCKAYYSTKESQEKVLAILKKNNLEIINPHAKIHTVPFSRFGMPNSNFYLKNEKSELKIMLGKIPVVGELKGSIVAWNAFIEIIRLAGFEIIKN